MRVIAAVLATFMVALPLVIILALDRRHEQTSGAVIARGKATSYQPEGGRVVPLFDYRLTLKRPGGETITVSVAREVYDSTHLGDEVSVPIRPLP